MSRILLVNPHSAISIYDKSKIKVAITSAPFVTLASLAGALLDAKHEVKIADLMIEADPVVSLDKTLREFNPEWVGVTFTTPLWNDARRIAIQARKTLPECRIMAGGVHACTLPEEVLKNGYDVIVIGEGERTIVEVCDGKEWNSINGLAFLKEGKLFQTEKRDLIENLDDLPLPAWYLHDLRYYRSPHIASRKNPVGYMETNRGCNHNCLYCSQLIFGHIVRNKSPERVVDEMFYMLECGFRDIHIKDNNFSADIDRAKTICRKLIEQRFPAPWALPTGINIHDCDREFFDLARQAGCYQIAFGIESGVEDILGRVNKNQSAEAVRRAVNLAHEAGLETVGFFMMGLPGDTIETMKKTTEFACSLPLTYAKASMTLPFPSSPMFRQIKREGRILSENWDLYNFHSTSEVWKHENLGWDEIQHYYVRFHRKFYFRPSYILRRFWRDVRMGQLLKDIKAVFANDWSG